ncbi:peptidoglycan editing factor PgeF [Marinobacter litoralis]|uniref:peptidoglycan editing factor PgeF n=1 Tax=Marinobacter litoralis TaxID=187981 RepID=UPI0018EB4576|nr:peptidoglycan editing factor PgeF [Marinobacter litoralis]MBJ6138645.1 peptidoglycan editing factor PgeF [Marinobacter litoralis]
MISESDLLRPDWPASVAVQALSTTRKGGVSQMPWHSLNLGSHVGDNPANVTENRQRLAALMGVEAGQIGWLNQVHGTRVVELVGDNLNDCPDADASFTREQGVVCAILTADCLPVILADRDGEVVGAAHAGWRSLCGGVLENLIRAMAVEPSRLIAWFGPSIGPTNFEVGPEVRAAFVEQQAEAEYAFSEQSARPGHFVADIYELARLRLSRAGVSEVFGGGLCTVNDAERFYSYRRDGQTGRMATLIWLD